MLEDFGIFLVLADRSLFAYHIEALVPSSPQSSHNNQTPQKLNGNKDVQFFSVGSLGGRTLVIWMRKKGVSSQNIQLMTATHEYSSWKALSTSLSP